MSEMIENELDQMVAGVEETERRYARTLRMLLDLQRDKENHQLALSARMGTSQSYLTSVSLKWIATNVSYAKDLPIFKSQIKEETGKISINDITLPAIQQREPDWRRQMAMSTYLAIRKNHKFGPLLLVAYQPWVYDLSSDNWGPDKRALKSSLNVKTLDSKANVVDLDTVNTSYFALDGQHRLMAIQGLRDLLEGRLYAKDRHNLRLGKKSLSREEVEQYYEKHETRLGLDVNKLPDVLNEMMGIEIVPAVQEGETFENATSRLRSIFVDVNENARRLEKGELTLLDENDGFRIVARTLRVKHPLFSKDDRVDESASQLSERSPCYTTLDTIVSIAQSYLRHKQPFSHWGQEPFAVTTSIIARPDDEEILDGVNCLAEYFKALQDLPSHREMIAGKPASEIRSIDGDDNILFRPIAQVALAEAIHELELRDLKLSALIKVLAKQENKGMLRLRTETTPWFGILCDTVDRKMRRKKENQDLCSEMFQYLLGGGFEDTGEREDLRTKFFNARRLGLSDEEEDQAIDISGNLVKREDFHLPHPWN